MPGEWEPHEATWLSWPHNPETWPGKFKPIPSIWVQMIVLLHQGEKIHLNVNDEKMEKEAKNLLQKAPINLSQIIFHRFSTNDCWIRDYGPIFVKKGNDLAITHWKFNMWGGKYPPWDLDNLIPQKISQTLNLEIVKTGILLEGGSIDVNGKGTLLTTESCLLNKNRNPHFSKKQIEEYLKKYLGCFHVLWLGEGIKGDDTDGHVDDLARFVNESSIVTVVEKDPADENYKPLQDNLKRLQKMKDQNGKSLNIVPIPMPSPIYYKDQRLPASYANFYIGNAVVLVPVFDDPNDQKALETIKRFFPDRKIVGIKSTDLVWGLGAFHCITQQQPL